MKYLLLGSLGHVTKPLAQQLIAAGHEVSIVTSKTDKRQAITALGAKPLVGSIEDIPFLGKVLKGKDAVYTMVPPKLDAEDWKGWIAWVGQGYAQAIRTSGIKKAVNLSSIGAHMPTGCGPVSGIHFVEEAMGSLIGVDILHLRCAFFYTNLFSAIGMIKTAGFYGNNYGADRRLVMVHPADIAALAAQELQDLHFSGHQIRYIAGDEQSSFGITAVLGKAIGKPDLPYVEFSDEQAFQGMLQAGLPEEIARNYTEMGSAIRSGEMYTHYQLHQPTLSPRKLEDFSKEFAAAYASGPSVVAY